MKTIARTDVIVAGAGPVGMFAALCLRARGLNVEIVDPLPGSSSQSYALALHSGTWALLEAHGVLDRLRKQALPIRGMKLHQNGKELADFDLTNVTPSDHPFLAVVSQRDLEAALHECLRQAGVTVRWNHRVSRIEDTGRRVHATVSELEERTIGYAIGHAEQFIRKNHEWEAEFLVGADGHDSFVRRALDIQFPEVGPAERFAVFEFKGSTPAVDNTVQLFLNPQGLVSVRWPLGPGTWRWGFQVDDEFEANERRREKDPELVQFVNATPFPVLDPEHLKTLMNDRAPLFESKVSHLYWRLLIRFEKRLAERFGYGRVWLAGDSGHMTGPIGIQSMNVGLREANDLAERIAAVTDARSSLNTLDDYNRDRLAEWRFLLGLQGKLHPMPDTEAGLAALAPVILPWLPASGASLPPLLHKLGFRPEGLPDAQDPHPSSTDTPSI